MTFPLPIVPFEQYMLAENSPEYPRVFLLDLRFTGSVDRAALDTAWQTALARHPMLHSRLSKSRRGWIWNEPEPTFPAIDWADEHVPLECREGEMIDLARESGVRMWVRAGGDAARLVLQFHHACCDGVGGLQFVAEMMAVYARQTGGDDAGPPLAPLDPSLLKVRGTFGLTRPTVREWLGHVAYTIRDSWRLVARRVTPVQAPRARPGEPATEVPFAEIDTYFSTPQELAELQSAAKAAGVTLNDLLMCQLFRAVLDWNAAEGHPSPAEWLRINVPTNLRRREDQSMPAANVMSFTFVDRQPDDCGKPRTLLESIRSELELIKERRLGLYFIGQLALLAGIPGGMSRMVNRRRSFATAVLTNLGDITRRFALAFPSRDGKIVIGNLMLESITGVPPLRPLTHVGIGIGVYADRLIVSVLCDRHHFTREQTRRFRETFLARVREGLPGAGSRAPDSPAVPASA